jgi:hypothetical protein
VEEEPSADRFDLVRFVIYDDNAMFHVDGGVHLLPQYLLYNLQSKGCADALLSVQHIEFKPNSGFRSLAGIRDERGADVPKWNIYQVKSLILHGNLWVFSKWYSTQAALVCRDNFISRCRP